MPLISIIITSFNSKETIKRSVLSALSQDWEDTEIIVVDDFSKDESFEILSKLAKNSSKITLLRHKKNKGYPAALNTAIRESKGEFIAIFDDDDDNTKNRISSQLRKILSYEKESKKQLILCYSNRDIYKSGQKKYDHVAFAIGRKSPEPNGIEVAEFILGFPVNKLKVWGMFGSCTLMARKSVFKEIGPFDESFRRSAELDFAIRAAFRGAYFIAVNKSLIKMHKTQGAYKKGRIPLIYSLKLRKKYKSFLKDKGFYYSSKLIAVSNFFYNKKRYFFGFTLRLLGLILAPIYLQKIITIKIMRLIEIFKK